MENNNTNYLNQEAILNDVINSLKPFLSKNNYFNLPEEEIHNEILLILIELNNNDYVHNKKNILESVKSSLMYRFKEDNSYSISDPVKKYLIEIGKYKLLSKEEEIELFNKYLKGDIESKNEIIERNLKLVVSVAKIYSKSATPFLDLIQEGNVGLIKAVEKFDPSLGNRFSTYAVYWIRQSITRAIADKEKSIRLPHQIQSKIKKMRKFETNYFKDNGKEPTIEETAKELETTTEEIENLKHYNFEFISMNNKVNEDEDIEYGDLVPSDEIVDENIISSLLNDELLSYFKAANLSDEQIIILIYRFGLNGQPQYTLEKIGKMIKKTRERVRLLEAKALVKLKMSPYKNYIKNYYDENYDIEEKNKEKSYIKKRF